MSRASSPWFDKSLKKAVLLFTSKLYPKCLLCLLLQLCGSLSLLKSIKNIFIWNKRICALLLRNFHVFCKFHRCGMASEIRLFFLLCDQLCPPCLTSRPSLVNSFWKPNWLIPIHGNCHNCILAGLARQNGGRKTVLAVASFSIAHY